MKNEAEIFRELCNSQHSLIKRYERIVQKQENYINVLENMLVESGVIEFDYGDES